MKESKRERNIEERNRGEREETNKGNKERKQWEDGRKDTTMLLIDNECTKRIDILSRFRAFFDEANTIIIILTKEKKQNWVVS